MSTGSLAPDFPTETIEEGRVRVLVPKLKAFVRSPSEYAPSKAPVFYNPVMELNRDLAVIALQAYQRRVNHEITVCEPLTGCGLRGIRFASEVRGVREVVMGDINEKAFQLARYNAAMCGLSEKIKVENEEANFLLNSYSAPHTRFDVIDIDPFGSPVHFLDSSIRALRDGGLLTLTATDMAPLCGVHPKACIRKYGGKPLRTEYCHELAVRLLAGCLATTAARYEIGIRVAFSHRAEHYVRLYATVKYGAKAADEALANMGYILHCFKCFHRESVKGLFGSKHPESCVECGSRLTVGGPLWVGELSNVEFLKLMEEQSARNMFRYKERMRKILSLMGTEVNGQISYYVVDKLCDSLNLPVPSVKKVVDTLRENGFQASLTHFNPRGIRSNVSASRITRMICELAR
jgi:tRNA (guanine26-N2/guanine27-N2)-dimethyltransferase